MIKASHSQSRFDRLGGRNGVSFRCRCRCMKSHFNAAETNDLPVGQPGGLDGLTIDECAVGGTEILNGDVAIGDLNVAVGTGNRTVGNLEIGGITASQMIRAFLKLDFPTVRPVWVDDKSVHIRPDKGLGWGNRLWVMTPRRLMERGGRKELAWPGVQ